MMRALVVLALVTAGCASSAPRPPLQGDLAGAGPAPTRSAPTIRWTGVQGFAHDRLPAIAHDGSVIVLAESGEDGGRGNPNLAIVVRDRRDRITAQHGVLAADEADTMYDDRGPAPALTARITAANRRLAELHRIHDLQPLTALVVPARAPDGPQPTIATGLGLHVAWRPSHLLIDRAGRTVVDRPTPEAWLAPPRAGCTNEAFLAGAWADPARDAAVLVIRYTGTDLCWEPDQQHHVVAW